MKVPVSWLKQYVDIEDILLQELVDEMIMSGSNVDGVEKSGEEISKVVVGKIEKIEKHPDAEKLVVCSINVGQEENLQIVTGANNITEGDYIPVALHGSTLPKGVKIKKGKLRGVESNGMLCSIEELALSREDYPEAPEHGIYIFKEKQELGKDIKEIFGLNEIIVDFELTNNRPDCFSMVGMAREVAATFRKQLRKPEIKVQETAGEEASAYISVSINEPALCARYAARVVKNVKIGPSPKWMKERLQAAGIRPINNIVDITNYVMLELGQPMHAFDYNKLEGKQIQVRAAAAGEKLHTLDEQERMLEENMLVIADASKPVAIAGVMGGANSEVDENTTMLLLESATFSKASVRRTAKKVGLRSESSSRFEKGLDPNQVIDAINRAAQLIEELGVGEVLKGIVDIYPTKKEPARISFAVEKINGLLGTELSKEEMMKYLTLIECSFDEEKEEVIIPTFRPDLERVADLAEEVARLYGYNNIPVILNAGTPTVGKLNYKQVVESKMKNTLEAMGLSEIYTYSFESPKVFDKINLSQEDSLRGAIQISNPLGEDYSIMRTVTVPGILNVLATNYNRRVESAAFYELGKVYLPKSLPLTELPEEKLKLTLGMYGNVDFFDLKGTVEELFDKLGIKNVEYDRASEYSYLHPGRTANVSLQGKVIGMIGEVHPLVLENYGIKTKSYIAVLDFEAILEGVQLISSYESLPKYPSMTRDIAMLVKDEVLVKQIEDIIKQRSGNLMESFKLFDVYKGKQIEEGYKSVAYSITFRAKDRTLTDEEVNKVMKKVINGLEYNLGAQLRDA